MKTFRFIYCQRFYKNALQRHIILQIMIDVFSYKLKYLQNPFIDE